MATYRSESGPDATPNAIQLEINSLETEQGRIKFKKWGKTEDEKKLEKTIPKLIAIKEIELTIKQREESGIMDNEEHKQKLKVAKAEYDIAIAKQDGSKEAVEAYEKALQEAKELLDAKWPV